MQKPAAQPSKKFKTLHACLLKKPNVTSKNVNSPVATPPMSSAPVGQLVDMVTSSSQNASTPPQISNTLEPQATAKSPVSRIADDAPNDGGPGSICGGSMNEKLTSAPTPMAKPSHTILNDDDDDNSKAEPASNSRSTSAPTQNRRRTITRKVTSAKRCKTLIDDDDKDDVGNSNRPSPRSAKCRPSSLQASNDDCVCAPHITTPWAEQPFSVGDKVDEGSHAEILIFYPSGCVVSSRVRSISKNVRDDT